MMWGKRLDAIDPLALPASVMLDSSVLLPALGKTKSTDDPASKPLFEALLTH
jgi:hypothetical protein